MATASIIFHLAAIILFILAACGISGGRINLIAAGLACWAISTAV